MHQDMACVDIAVHHGSKLGSFNKKVRHNDIDILLSPEKSKYMHMISQNFINAGFNHAKYRHKRFVLDPSIAGQHRPELAVKTVSVY